MKSFQIRHGLILFLLSINLSLDYVNSAKILFMLPVATKSHKNVFDPLITALAERQHNITVVAPLKLKTPLENVREIVPVPFEEINPSVTSGNPFERRKEGKLSFFLNFNGTFIQTACDKLYQSEEIREIMKTEVGSYDVIIVNMFMNACTLGLVHILQAPHIYVTTMPAMNFQVGKTGTHFPPSFVPSSLAIYSDTMTFKERVFNFLIEYGMVIAERLIWSGYAERMYRKHLGDHIPKVKEIDRNVSLILMNSHFSLTYNRPMLPDVVEVGGMFTRPAKPLPKDLEEFLSEEKDGFIYFSFGSIIQAKDMTVEMQQKFLNVFSRLKQKVIWKWEGEIPENLPINVKLSKWLPQQDILGHKNIRLFITHGGLLSTQEAVYHGVPLIGFPIFSDQDLNMIQAERAGFAITLEINEFSEKDLENAINRILEDPSIGERAKHLSAVFRDQPRRPVDTAVYWVEYVIRHKGAPHLRSVARDLNFIAYHSIDVITFLISVVLVLLLLTKKIVTSTFRFLFKSRSPNDIKLKAN